MDGGALGLWDFGALGLACWERARADRLDGAVGAEQGHQWILGALGGVCEGAGCVR